MSKKRIKKITTIDCPCGAVNAAGDKLSFDSCCGPLLHQLTSAITAEQLMRSRYTAYVMSDFNYLRQTWHPDTCPSDLNESNCIKWLGLQILSCSESEQELAEVHFVARYKIHGRAEKLEEHSRFKKINHTWFYVDGDILE